MGMFDRVWIGCPKCGNSIEFQSKAGDCTLADYNLDAVPTKIAGDIIGDEELCPKCHSLIKIGGKVLIYPYIERNGE